MRSNKNRWIPLLHNIIQLDQYNMSCNACTLRHETLLTFLAHCEKEISILLPLSGSTKWLGLIFFYVITVIVSTTNDKNLV